MVGLPYNFIKLLKGKNFAGHLSFSAPELITQPSTASAPEAEVKSKVDIWSLGCCLYYFVIKQDPFEGTSPAKTKENILNMTIGRNMIKDKLLDRLLNHCLVFNPADRPTALQVMQAQDQLETQELGYPRSRLVMDLLDGLCTP
jgi:serine/threonine protein kinase